MEKERRAMCVCVLNVVVDEVEEDMVGLVARFCALVFFFPLGVETCPRLS